MRRSKPPRSRSRDNVGRDRIGELGEGYKGPLIHLAVTIDRCLHIAAIVVHFAAKFSDASGTKIVPTLLTIGTLQLAGLAFMWAAVSRSISRDGFIGFCSLALPQLGYMVLGVFNVTAPGPYLADAIAIVVLPAIVFTRVIRTNSTDRTLATLDATASFLAANLSNA